MPPLPAVRRGPPAPMVGRTARSARAGVLVLLALLLALTTLPTATAAASATPGPDSATNRPGKRVAQRQASGALQRAQRLLRGRATPRDRAIHGDDATMALRDLVLARDSLTPQDRTSADQLLARPLPLSYDPYPAATTSFTHTDCSRAHFCIFRNALTTSPAQAQLIGQRMEAVYAAEVQALGYRAPVSDAGRVPTTVNNPDGRLDVFLADIGSVGLFGYCVPEQAARTSSSYCVLDNDFAASQYGVDPSVSMQATTAHEFFHMVQFAYNTSQDRWFMEGSATWMEDVVSPGANDYLRYARHSAIARPGVPLDYQPTGRDLGRYGAFLFFRYFSDRFGAGIVREMWDAATSYYGTGAAQIAVQRRVPWRVGFAQFAAANTEPVASYADGSAYGEPVLSRVSNLTRRHRGTGMLGVNLAHLTSASLRINLPRKRVGRRLRIQVDAPALVTSPGAVVLTRRRNGRLGLHTVRLDRKGNGSLQLRSRGLAYVTVVLANASTRMHSCRSDPATTYTCGGVPVDDHAQTYRVGARLR